MHQCTKCNHINEPKNLEFDKVIRIPDSCWDCDLCRLDSIKEGNICLYFCGLSGGEVLRPNMPKKACELSHIETWKKKDYSETKQ